MGEVGNRLDDQLVGTGDQFLKRDAGLVSHKLCGPDYTYRVDTDVITSITLTSSAEVNPDDPASVTFHINGGTYTVNDIVMPAGGSQVVCMTSL